MGGSHGSGSQSWAATAVLYDAPLITHNGSDYLGVPGLKPDYRRGDVAAGIRGQGRRWDRQLSMIVGGLGRSSQSRRSGTGLSVQSLLDLDIAPEDFGKEL